MSIKNQNVANEEFVVRDFIASLILFATCSYLQMQETKKGRENA